MQEVKTAAAILIALMLLLPGCGLTLTSERPPYEDLTAGEQGAVNIILSELKALDKLVSARSRALFKKTIDLSPVVDRDRIHVSFKGRFLALNVGDGVIHVATWENLTDEQRAGVAKNFKTTAAKAKLWYEKMFYRILAVSNGVKQWFFNINSPGKAFGSFSIFNMEVHPMRTAMGYFTAAGRKSEIWTFSSAACKNVLAQGEKRFGHMFTMAQSNCKPRFPKAKTYMNENTEAFYEASDPTESIYFICQWMAIGRDETESFDEELKWLYSKLK